MSRPADAGGAPRRPEPGRGGSQQKELRLALVLYGGVSLAVYIHGITREILELIRASRLRQHARRTGKPYRELEHARAGGSEEIWFEVLSGFAPELDLRIIVDVVAGASAGAINAVMLSRALTHDLPLDAHREMWLKYADISELMDERNLAGRWGKWYLSPIIKPLTERYLRRLVADPEARAKLSRFLRSKWFRPPFSGAKLCHILLDAMERMGEPEPGQSLLPWGQPLDCFITVTDYHGYPQTITIDDPPQVVEREHRRTWRFTHLTRWDGEVVTDMDRDQVPGLVFAARASSSYAGAFPPVVLKEMDQVLAERGQSWGARGPFVERIIGAAGPEWDAVFMDGGIINNKPFEAAIGAIRQRTAHREVDRRLVYVEPNPRGAGAATARTAVPGFFQTLRSALSSIPRNEPIRDDLEEIEQISRNTARIKQNVEFARPLVREAVTRLFFGRRPGGLTAARIERLRLKSRARAASDSGFVHRAYLGMRLSLTLDNIAELAACLARLEPGQVGDWRGRVQRWAAQRGFSVAGDAPADRAQEFLDRFDARFRTRRLRFLVSRLNELYALGADPATRSWLDQAKTAAYRCLEESLARTRASLECESLRARALRFPRAAAWDLEVDAFASGLRGQLALEQLDRSTDEAIAEIVRSGGRDRIGHPALEEVLVAYLGYDYFDIATYPASQWRDLNEREGIRVNRISPEDATTIREGGAEATLKGILFNKFGAFFSRAARENDYLWGRLHAADRLVDIVFSAARQRARDTRELKKRLFHAVLDAEAAHLPGSAELIAQLKLEIDAIATD